MNAPLQVCVLAVLALLRRAEQGSAHVGRFNWTVGAQGGGTVALAAGGYVGYAWVRVSFCGVQLLRADGDASMGHLLGPSLVTQGGVGQHV